MQNINIQQNTVFNSAQLELLDMMSHVKTPETLKDLRKVIRKFFAQKLEDTLSSMWAEGSLNEEKVESFRNLHEHTPYKS